MTARRDGNSLRVEDELAPVRGVIFGSLIALLMWAAIALTATAIGYGIAWAATL